MTNKHRCILCGRELRRGDTIVILSSPTEIISTRDTVLEYDYTSSISGEAYVHDECIEQAIPGVLKTLRSRMSDESELNVVSLLGNTQTTEKEFSITEFMETIEATGNKITRPEARAFLRKNRSINKLNDAVKRWFSSS